MLANIDNIDFEQIVSKIHSKYDPKDLIHYMELMHLANADYVIGTYTVNVNYLIEILIDLGLIKQIDDVIFEIQ